MPKLKTSSTCKFAATKFKLSAVMGRSGIYLILQLSNQRERKIATNILFVRIGCLRDIARRQEANSPVLEL